VCTCSRALQMLDLVWAIGVGFRHCVPEPASFFIMICDEVILNRTLAPAQCRRAHHYCKEATTPQIEPVLNR
jgi:hypothetical protein